ncbi:MAG TPA: glycosyltransferase [Terriglobales bacterium]|nr:glycosyltransferase [Terriglobales bacterium]
MIFATVGSQAPFDRLIRAVDDWAGSRKRSDVFAQIAAGDYCPVHVKYKKFVEPQEFRQLVQEAKVIVAHAGMGSIITALEMGKPIVVMPRRARYRETRNDHQVAAANHFGAQGRVIVADDENRLAEVLDYAVTLGETERIEAKASDELITTIRNFIDAAGVDR